MSNVRHHDSVALKLRRTPGVLLGWLALPFVVACFVAAYVLFENCENAILKEVSSPDGRHNLVVFERKCSGTVAWTTHVSVVGANASLPNNSGNALVSFERHGSLANSSAPKESEVVARWAGPNIAELTYFSGAPVQFVFSEAGGVQVTHGRAR
jgi:hypothetical protein